MRLAADRIRYAYRQHDDVLRGVSVAVDEGQVVFVFGANGSGKTTLLDCLSGVRGPRTGRVTIDDVSLAEFSPRERARRIGVVPQLHEPVFTYTVQDAVLMGRAPHLGLFARPGPIDRNAVTRALEAVGAGALKDRPYTEISGGERQLVLIARGLAQGASCLLMDEPVAHLDPHHQRDTLEVVRRLADEGFSFVVTSHHPNHALLYADEVALLDEGTVVVRGTPDEAIREETLRAVYGMEFEIVRSAQGSRAVLPQVLPRRRITP